MRPVRTLALLLTAAFTVLLVLGFTVSRSPSPPAGPLLRLVRSAPPTIRGERFKPFERVRVTANSRRSYVRASRNGVFVITIRAATRCDALRVLAEGSRRSYAVLKVLPAPECLPAQRP